MMTQEEKKRIIEIYGPNYKKSEIPAYIRKRDERGKEEEEREPDRKDWNLSEK